MNKLNHVAFIMDGNGRWGLKHKKNRNLGHLEGVNTVKKIVDASIKLKIPIVTFYVFSSENWNRPVREVKYLFKLIYQYFKSELKNVVKNNIKINIIGSNKKLPIKTKKILNKITKLTKNNKKIIVNLAINYGSKNEIIDSLKKINSNKLNITENSINKFLYTTLPFPDILIRTGGRKRLSNFMLWQLAYAELFFLEKLWPDFNKNDLKTILKKYSKINRNFGAI
jgi:undecaprenyl diphosphate synthase